MPCTTILVGKDASYDGSTIVARNEDSQSGLFCPKKFTVVQAKDQPKKYKSVISKVEIDLPDNPMRYTLVPNAIDKDGIWGACGINEKNISMSATETLTTNERVQGADPLVRYNEETGAFGGIGEEDMVTLVLPYISSAREGVIRLGSLLEKYGTYEMNGIAFQDTEEIWWLETIGGHHWMARRVPDDCYVIMPNQLGIDELNFEDAYGEQVENMCSLDLKDFVEKHHLDLSFEDDFNPREAFGSDSDADKLYNTPRAWVLQRLFNPNSNIWDGEDADFTPFSNDIPWCRTPERKINIEDVKYALSNHFQGTVYDPYSKIGDDSMRGAFRPIGINRNSFLGCSQLKPYVSDAGKGIQWLAFSSNVFNAMLPFYTNINKTPEYFENTTANVSTDNFYWTNRLIAVIADAHYASCSSHIERYQLSLQSKCNAVINEYDEKLKHVSYKDASSICEEANEKIASIAKKETDELLDKVLLSGSNEMRNKFSRSDA